MLIKSNKLKIRKATVRDAARLCEFMSAIRKEGPPTLFRRDKDPTLKAEREFITKANRVGVLFICSDTCVKGMLGASIATRPQRKHSCEFGMCVLKDFRGQGIGTQLLESLIAWAKQRGLHRIECGAFGNNARAIRLYKRFGFTIEGRRRRAIEIDGKYADIIELGLLIK